MSSLFDRLKQSRGQQASQLQQRLEQQGQKTFKKDPRIWKWTWNKEGVSENIIRFLPIPMVDMKKQQDGLIPEDSILTPVAMLMKHQFEGPGGWYINNSPQTFGEKDPVREHDYPLWQQQKATKDEALKERLKKRLPDTKYYANILIINDVNVPENNGKVMLLEFGAAIKKILDAAQTPKFSNQKAFDPYDLWEGADLNLNLIGEKKKFGNWEGLVADFKNVTWANPAPLANGDEAKQLEIWEKEHSLFEFYDPANFKTYEELETQLRKVLQIPDDQPLVENAASTVAQSPTAQAGQATQSAQAQNQAPDTTPVQNQPATQTQSTQQQAPASAGTIDEFEQFLNSPQ